MKNQNLHILAENKPKLVLFCLHAEFVAAARQGDFQSPELQQVLQAHNLTAKPSVAVLGTVSDACADEFFISNVPQALCDTITTKLRNCNAIRCVDIL